MSRVHLTRRELVASAALTGALAAVPPAWGRQLLSRRPRVGPGDFLDGVASGEPSPTAVTFWSRLDTHRPRSGARLVIARDEGLRRVVATTIVPTGAGVNGALKARVGRLRPDEEYFYVWESGTGVSPIGRTRTAPPLDSNRGLRIAFSSCQQYAVGYYGAHAHAASIPDVDLYAFLGDYIYEHGNPRGPDMRRDRIDAVDLGSYRRKYALYRSDPALREVHRLHPSVHVWDDHEVENNYSDNNPAPAPVHRSAAYRASAEWLPRMSPARERHRLYKKLSFGRVADVFMLDERQYRTGDGDGQPRRILGDTQMNWLIQGLKESSATWKVIAQQVVVATIYTSTGGVNRDAWDGYPEDRARLLGEIERAGIPNVVFLSGDAHVFEANLLSSDFESFGDGSGRRAAATEYVGGSVTSLSAGRPEAEIQARAPWNRQYNGQAHGYAAMTLAHDQAVTEYLGSDTTRPDGGTVPIERFYQPAGANDMQRESLSTGPPPPQPPPDQPPGDPGDPGV
jgi:alkaline phosphatase D